MQKSQVFGAVRATTIAALCAGAGLALTACEKAATDADKKPATEKPAGDANCGGDKKCSGDKKCGGDHKCGSAK